MNYTETEKSEFKREFLRRRRSQLVLAAVLAPIIVAAVMYQRGVAGTILGVSAHVAGSIFLALAVGALLFSFRNWRCPACSKYLGRTINPRHCPNCGVELRG